MLTWAKRRGISASLGERAILGFDTKRKGELAKLGVEMELNCQGQNLSWSASDPRCALLRPLFIIFNSPGESCLDLLNHLINVPRRIETGTPQMYLLQGENTVFLNRQSWTKDRPSSWQS